MFTSLVFGIGARYDVIELLLICWESAPCFLAMSAWIFSLAFLPSSSIFLSWYSWWVNRTPICFLFLPTTVGFEPVLSRCSVLPFFSGKRWRTVRE